MELGYLPSSVAVFRPQKIVVITVTSAAAGPLLSPHPETSHPVSLAGFIGTRSKSARRSGPPPHATAGIPQAGIKTPPLGIFAHAGRFTGFPPWVQLWSDPSPLPPRPKGLRLRARSCAAAGFAGVGSRGKPDPVPGPAPVQGQVGYP